MRFALVLFPPLLAAQTPTTVTAKAVGPAPGAIVCRNLATVNAMLDLYAEAVEERLQAVETQGASERVNGPALRLPDLARYGCTLAKAGTPMTLVETDGAAGVVTFKPSPKGRVVRGVTQSNMYSEK